jgi:hypothetical protein
MTRKLMSNQTGNEIIRVVSRPARTSHLVGFPTRWEEAISLLN